MPISLRSVWSLVPCLLLFGTATISVAEAQVRGASDGLPPRDEWQRVPEIIAAMGDIEGKRIADIAAGQGYLTRWLARKVGPNGRVYAVEIGEAERQALQKLAKDSLPNIAVIEGTPTDPRLPDTLDAAVVLNSYHEFSNYREMLAGIRRALKPRGILVLVDNLATKDESRDWQASHHGLSPKYVDAELREAGFEIVSRRDDFIVQPYSQWLITARRPRN